jgi:glyoxalase family protein
MQLTGIHHLTAITADAPGNHAFYTGTLGMRLVKKTVNQDDVSAYHLFYADGLASPGSDLTFFDWPAPREGRGTHSVVRSALRVTGEATCSAGPRGSPRRACAMPACGSAMAGLSSTSRIPRASA